MSSSPVSPASPASRWWKHNGGIAVCDLPHPSAGGEVGSLRCPRHRDVLPCDHCALRDQEATTAGWVIGLVGLLIAMLLALSCASGASDARPLGALALALTLLLVAGAIGVGLLVAQLYGGERIGLEVSCPACQTRFVWAAADTDARCPGCSTRVAMQQGQLVSGN